MIGLKIIIAILLHLPTMIHLLKEIIAVIEELPAATRVSRQHELLGYILAWHHGGGDANLSSALHAMGRDLGCASAEPAKA